MARACFSGEEGGSCRQQHGLTEPGSPEPQHLVDYHSNACFADVQCRATTAARLGTVEPAAWETIPSPAMILQSGLHCSVSSAYSKDLICVGNHCPAPCMITCGGHQCQHPLCSIASNRRRPTFSRKWVGRESETQRVLRCACQRISASDGRVDTAAEAILHRYWESRGIFDESRRERLVEVARRLDHAGAHLRSHL